MIHGIAAVSMTSWGTFSWCSLLFWLSLVKYPTCRRVTLWNFKGFVFWLIFVIEFIQWRLGSVLQNPTVLESYLSSCNSWRCQGLWIITSCPWIDDQFIWCLVRGWLVDVLILINHDRLWCLIILQLFELVPYFLSSIIDCLFFTMHRIKWILLPYEDRKIIVCHEFKNTVW